MSLLKIGTCFASTRQAFAEGKKLPDNAERGGAKPNGEEGNKEFLKGKSGAS
jgi:hypothetical protein